MTKLSFAHKSSLILLAAAATCALMIAADWPTLSGGPQRDGWARSEKAIGKENVGGLDLLYTYKADNESKGLYSLTSPLVNGLLITYRGFKEMLVFSGSGDNVYSDDADLNKLIWKTHFDVQGDKPKAGKPTATCPEGLTASVAMAGSSSTVSFGRRPPPPPTTGPNGERLAPPIGGSGFGSVGAFFAVASDGYLHTLNPSTGRDLIPAVKFVPAGSRVSALNVSSNTIYAVTSGDCGDSPNAIYAVDPSSSDKKVSTFPLQGKGAASPAGTAIGSDGTVYVEANSGAVFALAAHTLEMKDSLTVASPSEKNAGPPGTAPLVFSWKGKDLIVAAGAEGRLYLLDSHSLGGADHHTPLFQTEPIASAGKPFSGNGFHEGFSSWSDAATETRWVYASLWGPPAASVKFPMQNGDAAHGSILAFKVSEQNGQPILSPAWISGDVQSPASPVTANGLVLALSTGQPTRQVKANGKPYSVAEIKKAGTRATLYALDAETGKQLYASGSAVTGASYGSGLAVANGRIYFAAGDNSIYAFGFSKMQPQLTER